MISLSSLSLIRNRLKKRTTLEKSLIGVTVFLCLVLIGLAIALGIASKKESFVCHTPACKEIGSMIRNSLDLTVDPCTDFYSYCCGNWLKTHELPPSMRKYGLMEKLQVNVFAKLNDLLKTSNASGIAIENAVKLYDSCMNTGAIEILGGRPLLHFFSKFGGWPVVNNNWEQKDFDSLSALALVQLKTGYGYIIPIIVGTDPKNTSRKVLQIDQASLMLSKEILLNINTESSKKDLGNFRKLFIKIAMLLGATDVNLAADFDSIIDLELQLIKMMSSEEAMSNMDFWYNKMTVADLMEKVPQINWLMYLQSVTNTSLLSVGSNYVIQKNDIIIAKDLPYIKKVAKYIMHKKNSRQIANYLGWRVAMNLMLHLPQNFSAALQDFYKGSGYSQETPERWELCTNLVDSAFTQTTTFLYIRQYFPAVLKKEVMKLILDIRFQFENSILKSNWMKRNSKNEALKKLQEMKVNVGYPEWMTDELSLDDFFMKIHSPIMDNNVFENYIKLTEHRTMQVLKSLRIKPEKEEWPISPLTANAAYNRNLNSITFPAAFLQLPVYDSSLPDYFNYAAIGSIIGHEITHGFDNEGSKRDASGKVANWWDPETKRIFDQKATCFVKQYDNYGLNGKQTLAENIADSGGLQQTYNAYNEWRKKKIVEEKLPGLEKFSSNQLFFLSYGSIWCTKYSPGALNYTITNGKYAPSAYRIIGSTSNLKEFAQVFECGIHNFNESTLCSIW